MVLVEEVEHAVEVDETVRIVEPSAPPRREVDPGTGGRHLVGSVGGILVVHGLHLPSRPPDRPDVPSSRRPLDGAQLVGVADHVHPRAVSVAPSTAIVITESSSPSIHTAYANWLLTHRTWVQARRPRGRTPAGRARPGGDPDTGRGRRPGAAPPAALRRRRSPGPRPRGAAPRARRRRRRGAPGREPLRRRGPPPACGRARTTVRRAPAPRPVHHLAAGGGAATDRVGDHGVGLGVDLPEQVRRPLVGVEPLEHREEPVGERFGEQHRVVGGARGGELGGVRGQGLGQPRADVPLPLPGGRDATGRAPGGW